MKFIDETEIDVAAGDGGCGCVAFRREKYRPHGGPDGGDGGKGGDIVFVADGGLTTLFDITLQRHLRAPRGAHGRGKGCDGAQGEDLVVQVPLGTIVTDVETGEPVADLTDPGMRAIVAAGGHGGRGNKHFATPTHQAPRRAEPGQPGERRQLRLEIRVLADVGLVGKPNAGKSTLLGAVSAARPRVAAFPFTTLTPHLGVVHLDDGVPDTFVMADIPGLIYGAHRGAGLGTRFLRHLGRTAVLVHLVDASSASPDTPLADFDAVNRELASYDAGLAEKPQLAVATKLDLPEAQANLAHLRAAFEHRGVAFLGISAITGAGIPALLAAIGRLLDKETGGRARPAGGRRASLAHARDDAAGPPVGARS
jgi:GTP-binding protein